MSSAQKIIQAAAGNAAGEGLYVEEIFSTYLYDGTGSAQTITNGVDLENEGGMVWVKSRSYAYTPTIQDTELGAGNYLITSSTAAQQGPYLSGAVSSFNSDGFSIGTFGSWNASGETFVSWTFRKAPKFFDVVTYTGTGSAQTIAHNLGSVPGCIIVKQTSGVARDWPVYHRAIDATNPSHYKIPLNKTEARANEANIWNDTEPTSTHFTVGSDGETGGNGATYVAYLFAHNDGDGEFGEDADQDIIKCGSVPASAETTEDLGWEPQWLLIKRTDSTGDWQLFDNMRGFFVGGPDNARLRPNLSNAEDGSNSTFLQPRSTGFYINTNYFGGGPYIYIAIRRGPMKTPESGTDVFAPFSGMGPVSGRGTASNPSYLTNFPVDLGLFALKSGSVGNTTAIDRLRGSSPQLITSSTNAEAANTSWKFDSNIGLYIGLVANANRLGWMFRRAPGFFDVVAYDGDGASPRQINHNLGVVPELIIIKRREDTGNWITYIGPASSSGDVKYMLLNTTNALVSDNTGDFSSLFYDTLPTSSVFTVGNSSTVNRSDTGTYIAYLFATLPGVSKVGSYTGNGTSQTIDCGFSTGARFVLTKRTNSTGNWNVWDSERGIVAGNDPRLELNTTDAEDTGHDYIDPDSSGFIVNYVADDDDDSNVNGDEYIFLAIS